jgi:hypothetical protein
MACQQLPTNGSDLPMVGAIGVGAVVAGLDCQVSYKRQAGNDIEKVFPVDADHMDLIGLSNSQPWGFHPCIVGSLWNLGDCEFRYGLHSRRLESHLGLNTRVFQPWPQMVA